MKQGLRGPVRLALAVTALNIVMRVMGPKIGDTILAWSVRVTKPEFTMGRTVDSEVQLQYSNTNSRCGEVIHAPR